MPVRYSAKDPYDVDDFTLNWAPQLAADETISASSATLLAGDATVVSATASGRAVIVRVSGGTVANSPARITQRVTTSTGRQLEQTMIIPIKEA